MYKFFNVNHMSCVFYDVLFRPATVEVSHFASLRNGQRELVILRSDNGQTWSEHESPHVQESDPEKLTNGDLGLSANK